MMGRPTSYNRAVADRVCELVASNTCGLETLCDSHSELPSARTVYRWVAAFPDFCQAYVRACEARADLLFEQGLEIADNNLDDFVWRDGKGEAPGWWEFRGEHVARAKLRVETRMRMAGKLSPKKYGDKQFVEHSGSLTVTTVDETELIAEFLELIASGRVKPPPGVGFEEREDDEPQSEEQEPWASLV